MKEKLYLAYGSNLNIEQMALRCPTARLIGPAVLEGYRLVFRGGPGAAVANIEPYTGARVPCLVWAIRETDELALDRYEGFPFLYQKACLSVALNGKSPIRAMAYVMSGGRPMAQPSPRYLDIIAEGYRTAGFNLGLLYQSAGVRCQ